MVERVRSTYRTVADRARARDQEQLRYRGVKVYMSARDQELGRPTTLVSPPEYSERGWPIDPGPANADELLDLLCVLSPEALKARNAAEVKREVAKDMEEWSHIPDSLPAVVPPKSLHTKCKDAGWSALSIFVGLSALVGMPFGAVCIVIAVARIVGFFMGLF